MELSQYSILKTLSFSVLLQIVLTNIYLTSTMSKTVDRKIVPVVSTLLLESYQRLKCRREECASI